MNPTLRASASRSRNRSARWRRNRPGSSWRPRARCRRPGCANPSNGRRRPKHVPPRPARPNLRRRRRGSATSIRPQRLRASPQRLPMRPQRLRMSPQRLRMSLRRRAGRHRRPACPMRRILIRSSTGPSRRSRSRCPWATPRAARRESAARCSTGYARIAPKQVSRPVRRPHPRGQRRRSGRTRTCSRRRPVLSAHPSAQSARSLHRGASRCPSPNSSGGSSRTRRRLEASNSPNRCWSRRSRSTIRVRRSTVGTRAAKRWTRNTRTNTTSRMRRSRRAAPMPG